MKTRINLLAIVFMLTSIFTFHARAAETMTREQAEARVTQIKDRVEEIRAMDIRHMSKVERKEIKTELKGMNKELRSLDGTIIYVSTGALILIIVLLILLL